MNNTSLYENLGGYDGISGFVNNLLQRLQGDAQLARFWQNRGADGVAREKQLLIDFLCANTGGPVYYTGRNMLDTHRGMGISQSDWQVFLQHAGATLQALSVPEVVCDQVVDFVLSLQADVVDG